MNLFDTLAATGGFLTYVLDGAIVIILLVAIIVGGRRLCRNSLANLLVQLTSLTGAILLGNLISPSIANWTIERLDFSIFIPSRLYWLASPIIEFILTALILLMLTIAVFIFFKSFLGVFAYQFDLPRKLFVRYRPSKVIDSILSIVFSVLNAYSYLLVTIVVLAFPIFNIVQPGSLSRLILTMTPFVSSGVEKMYEPVTLFLETMELVRTDLDQFMSEGTVDIEGLAQTIVQNPETITQLISILPDETLAEIDQILTEHGLTQGEAIEQLNEKINKGQVNSENIQSLLNAHLP